MVKECIRKSKTISRNLMWSEPYSAVFLSRRENPKPKSSFFLNMAGYTAIPAACGWLKAVFEVPRPFGQEQGQRIIKNKIHQSPKGNTWSAVPVTLLCMVVNWNERKQGSSLSSICSEGRFQAWEGLGGTDGRTDGWRIVSLPLFYRTWSPSGPLPKNLSLLPCSHRFGDEKESFQGMISIELLPLLNWVEMSFHWGWKKRMPYCGIWIMNGAAAYSPEMHYHRSLTGSNLNCPSQKNELWLADAEKYSLGDYDCQVFSLFNLLRITSTLFTNS